MTRCCIKIWEAASEEQKARIQQLKAQADKISRENGNEDQEDGVEIINDAPKRNRYGYLIL